MSLIYQSQTGRGRRAEFNVNSAGAWVLCQLHLTLGLPIYEPPKQWSIPETTKTRVLYSATADQCAQWASVIRDPENVQTIILHRPPQDVFEGTNQEYYSWTQRWADFLTKCARRGGYATDN